MLELVSSNHEKFLLKRSNLSLDKVCSLSLDTEEKWLCLGAINKIKGDKTLIKKLKKHQEFRIWYSSINTEELNTYYYLVNRIFNNIKNPTIYIINPTTYKKEIYSIMACSKETVENLVNYQQKLTVEEIKEAANYWDKLVSENADLRILENNKLISVPYQKLETEILNKLSKYKEISSYEFVGQELLATDLFYIRNVVIWDFILKKLIKQNKIKIIRTEKQLDELGYERTINYLSIAK